jgi:uncharacterized membrane protein YkvI
MASNSVFQRIWLPGFIFQSVIIGGGYATGRELVEFFLANGPTSGLFGMLVATIAFSLLVAVAFEFARITRSYDYRSFFRQLLGRAWFLFEFGYLLMALLILAVIGAASGELVAEHLGASSDAGVAGLMILIGLLVFWGTGLIERVLAGWSFLLYATYAVFILIFLLRYGEGLPPAMIGDNLDGSWFIDSLRYVGYSVVVVPLILFCVRHMESRRDALLAGMLAGPIAMAPAALFYLGMAASYPAIVEAPVPANYMIQRLGIGWIELLFYVVVFGTFVETGTAMIHAINERISHVYLEHGKSMPRWLRPMLAVAALVAAVILANRVGLIYLIARGYGTLTYFFIAVVILPLFTIGLWRIARSGPSRDMH